MEKYKENPYNSFPLLGPPVSQALRLTCGPTWQPSPRDSRPCSTSLSLTNIKSHPSGRACHQFVSLAPYSARRAHTRVRPPTPRQVPHPDQSSLPASSPALVQCLRLPPPLSARAHIVCRHAALTVGQAVGTLRDSSRQEAPDKPHSDQLMFSCRSPTPGWARRPPLSAAARAPVGCRSGVRAPPRAGRPIGSASKSLSEHAYLRPQSAAQVTLPADTLLIQHPCFFTFFCVAGGNSPCRLSSLMCRSRRSSLMKHSSSDRGRCTSSNGAPRHSRRAAAPSR
jgi:hypothetical protein